MKNIDWYKVFYLTISGLATGIMLAWIMWVTLIMLLGIIYKYSADKQVTAKLFCAGYNEQIK